MFDWSKSKERPAVTTDGASPLPRKNWKQDWQLISCLVAVALLFVGWCKFYDYYYVTGYDWPEGPFFDLLHLYVTGLSLILSYTFWRRERAISLVIAALVAILFNPLIPLEIENWTIFYFFVAAWFAYAAMLAPSIKKLRAITLRAMIGFAVADPGAHSPLEAINTDQQDAVTSKIEISSDEDFYGKKLRNNLFWGITIATGAEFVIRGALSSGEDRGTNVLSFAIIAIICWLIGKSTHRTTAAIWTFAAASLVFSAISLSRYST